MNSIGCMRLLIKTQLFLTEFLPRLIISFIMSSANLIDIILTSFFQKKRTLL